jgi:hypothetical protein
MCGGERGGERGGEGRGGEGGERGGSLILSVICFIYANLVGLAIRAQGDFALIPLFRHLRGLLSL